MVIIAGRAFGFAAFDWTSLWWVGLAPTFLLISREWREFQIALGPLVGWAVWAVSAYGLLPFLSLGRALVIIGTLPTGINIFTLIITVHRNRSLARRPPRMALRVLSLAAVNSTIFVILILPHIYHESLAILPPNQDDKYFVELTDRMWAISQELRLAVGDYIIEQGWAFHLIMALSRVTPWMDAFEAVALAGYFAIAIAVGPN